MRYVFGDSTLDTRQHELRHAGALIAPRPKVFHLLAYLLAHRVELTSFIGRALWPYARPAHCRHAAGRAGGTTPAVARQPH